MRRFDWKIKELDRCELLRRMILICCALGGVISAQIGFAQNRSDNNIDIIIDKIKNLESQRDPKCYATANRLEDFMYGIPLDNAARNLRIEIQKEVSLYVRTLASDSARVNSRSSISREDILSVVDPMAQVGRLRDGDYFFRADSMVLRIKRVDFEQYASVAYSFRSLLSVEQDLFFVEESNLLPLSDDGLEALNTFLNISTLASLNMATIIASQSNDRTITEDIMRRSWIRIFNKPVNKSLFAFQYPQMEVDSVGNELLKLIITQKLYSYSQYNNLSTSLFLRNIQVFFAKQRWPVEQKASDDLKNYFLESLIAFTQSLIQTSFAEATSKGRNIIKMIDVQRAGDLFLPFEANQFEDIIFFPNDLEQKITIESYDLDAFRDGGLHWRVLSYALEDPQIFAMTIDPTAAELIVENVAQLGVLVLRLAGQASHNLGKKRLDLDDLESGFKQLQVLINDYDELPPKQPIPAKIASAKKSDRSSTGRFVEVAQSKNIEFQHRSSDWLSRLIRSYVYSESDTTAKLAIPPAFGGSGVAAEDINNDGFIDILLLGGAGNRLYLNQGNGSFNEITDDVELNLWNEEKQSFEEARQPIIADFNNDGFQDILMIYVDALHRVLMNVDGSKFLDVSQRANLGGKNQVAGPATVLDYDQDGLLDVFIGYFGNYLRGELPNLSRDNQNGSPNKLYRNLGDFKFEEVTFTRDSLTDSGWTQAVGHTDINQDGRQDLIVGNDFGVNKYYLNTDSAGFIEVSQQLKTDKPSYTMNVGIGDLNADQFPDLYISNIVVMQKEEKYVNPNAQTTMKFDPEKMLRIRTVEANDLFLSRTEEHNFKEYELAELVDRGFSATGWSWDADFFDFDNDGDEDLYCLNGMNDFKVYSNENPSYYGVDSSGVPVQYAESNRERNVFFINQGGRLHNEAERLGTDLLTNSRSASYADFDSDGDLDIIINNYHDRAMLLENQAAAANDWLKIKLIGDPSQSINRDAIGSSLILSVDDMPKQWREIHSTTGYLSVHPKEQHFGLGTEAEEISLEIRWSNGENVKISSLDKNRKYTIIYPDNIVN